MTSIVASLDMSAQLMRALASLCLQTSLAVAGLCIVIAIGMGLKTWFKHFRLYSRHPIAKRIRRFLSARRAAKRARA